ncbi:MAG: hypothetical protein CMK09_16905 [Ponticaulis sp.]|nr:hypothetical protein [Ponticaulis sp.]|tara:strand:+ start:28533 stop:31226 length:2694 start_codon:yes stop_codon:yes gene_type:complete
MSKALAVGVVSLSALMAGLQGQAQTADPVADEDRVMDAVQVTSSRFVNQALTDIEPDIRLSEDDISAYGASSIEELFATLGPELSSGRGRGGGGGGPIVLLDGVRIASFREIRGYPPEAIQRMDVLPEEAALKFGYGADQRVVNIVLKPEFSAWTLESELGGPLQGDGFMTEFEVGYITLNNGKRTSVDGEIETDAGILESDRGIGDGLGADSLTDETDELSLAASYHRAVSEKIHMTLSGNLDVSTSDELLGFGALNFTLPGNSPFSTSGMDTDFSRYVGLPGVLQKHGESVDANASLTLTRETGDWFVTSTTQIGRSESKGETDREPDAQAFQDALTALAPSVAPDADLTPYLTYRMEETKRISNTASTNLLANGRLFELPAGSVSTGLSLDLSHVDRTSETLLDGVTTQTELDRQIGKIQGSFDIPFISDDMDIPLINDLSANISANASEYSDFGSLYGFDGTLIWRPIEQLRFLGSYSLSENAPGMSQLGDTTSFTPNAEVFDYVTGESVQVTRIDGGNPDLIAETRQVFRISSDIEPFEEAGLNLQVSYLEEKVDDPIGGFPGVDAELQAVFPDRFLRDPDGNLISYDVRPVNFVEETRRDFEWRLTWRKTFEREEEETSAPNRGPGAAGSGNRPALTLDRLQQMASNERGKGRLITMIQSAHDGDTPLTEAEAQARLETLMSTEAGQSELLALVQNTMRQRLAEGGGPPPAARSGGRGRGFGGGRGRGRGGSADPRIFTSLRHVWHLEDQRLLAEGYPVQDFLNGSADGSSGGQAEHEVQLQSGFFYKNFGGRLGVNWQSGTEVVSGSGEALTFSDYASTELRLFYNVSNTSTVGQKLPWLEGARFSLEIDNLFDETREVRDANGVIPTRYDANRLDPEGRVVMLGVRKQF